MAVVRRVECVARSTVKLWVRWRCADWSSSGRVSVASVCSAFALALRSAGAGGWSGSAMLQRCVVVLLSWVESASLIMSLFAKKASRSAERISRSAAGIWPRSWAVAMSIRECSSGGRSAALKGRSERVSMRIWVVRRDVRAADRAYGYS